MLGVRSLGRFIGGRRSSQGALLIIKQSWRARALGVRARAKVSGPAGKCCRLLGCRRVRLLWCPCLAALLKEGGALGAGEALEAVAAVSAGRAVDPLLRQVVGGRLC